MVETVRQRIKALLQEQELNALELSGMLSIPEKEVYSHLEHVARSAERQGMELVVTPSRCMSCGYVFRDRIRLTRPSRCPRCKKTHITVPSFQLS